MTSRPIGVGAGAQTRLPRTGLIKEGAAEWNDQMKGAVLAADRRSRTWRAAFRASSALHSLDGLRRFGVAKRPGAGYVAPRRWAISAAVAQLPYTELVGGSNPSSPTTPAFKTRLSASRLLQCGQRSVAFCFLLALAPSATQFDPLMKNRAFEDAIVIGPAYVGELVLRRLR